MRILHTVAPAEYGGLEDVVIHLCGGLRERGHQVVVASVVGGLSNATGFREALRTAGVEVRPLVISGRQYFREIAEVRRVCKEIAPDVVNLHGYRPCVLHPRAVRPQGTPLVATLHGFTGGGLRNRAYEWLQVRAVRRIDAVIAVSRKMAGQLAERGVPAGIIHPVQNAWRARRDLRSASDARAALEVPPDRFHIGWVGRLSREKGPDLFVEALARLGDSSGITASIIGDGPLRGELQRRSAKLNGVEARFHGLLPDAATLFRGFDVFVLSSRTEGTPMVLFESMAASVPIVATTVGGVPDVVDVETAVLVRPEDPTSLAEGIRRVRLQPLEASELAERGLAALHRRFSEGPWLDHYEEVYRSLVGPSRTDSPPDREVNR